MRDVEVIKSRWGQKLGEDIYSVSASMAYTEEGEYPHLLRTPTLAQCFPASWIERCRVALYDSNEDREALVERQRLLSEGACDDPDHDLVILLTLGDKRRLSDTREEPIGIFGEYPSHLRSVVSDATWAREASTLYPVRPFRRALVGYGRSETFIPGSLLGCGVSKTSEDLPSFLNLDLVRYQFDRQALQVMSEILEGDAYNFIEACFGMSREAQERSIVFEYLAHEVGHHSRTFLRSLPSTWSIAPLLHALEEFRADLVLPPGLSEAERERIMATRILLRLGLDIGRSNESDIDVVSARLWVAVLAMSDVCKVRSDGVSFSRKELGALLSNIGSYEAQIAEMLAETNQGNELSLDTVLERIGGARKSEKLYQIFRHAAVRHKVQGLR